jgi:hypothetical protein
MIVQLAQIVFDYRNRKIYFVNYLKSAVLRLIIKNAFRMQKAGRKTAILEGKIGTTFKARLWSEVLTQNGTPR